MSIKRIKPAYFLGTPNLTDPKVLGSKVDEMIVAINDLEPVLNEKVYVSEMFNTMPFELTPTLVPTATKIINKIEGGFPAASLNGYKVVGTVDVSDSSVIQIYLGSVILGQNWFGIFPFKTSGNVSAYDDNYGLDIQSSFSNSAYFTDSDDSYTYPVEMCTIANEYVTSSQVDLYLIIASSTFVGNIQGEVSFEYEFLVPEDTTVDFIIY